MQADPPDRAIAALQLIAAEGFDVALGRVVAFDELESVVARFVALRAGLLDEADHDVHEVTVVHDS